MVRNTGMTSRTGSRSWTFVLGVLLAACCSFGSGCDTGSRAKAASTAPVTTTGGGGGGGGGGTTGQLTYGTTALTTVQAGQIIPGTVHALTFTLQASGASAVSVTSMTFTASGTVNETRFGAAVVVEDANNNGTVDTAEAAASLGSTNPGFTANNGTCSIAFTTPLTLTAGQTRQFFLLLSGTAISPVTTTDAGATVITAVSAATSIAATAGGTATTAGGTFGTQTVTLGIHDHLLLSEVCFTPTAGEFIEIFNPTPYAVPMTNYHITDVSHAGTGTQFQYWQLVNGGLTPAFAPLSTSTDSDWSLRFPSGFTINSGQVIILAMDGAGFAALTFTPAVPTGTPVLAMRNVATGQTQMLVFRGNSAFDFQPANAQGATPVSYASGGLTDGGEGVILFFWDGQATPVSALVTDIDYVFYGATSGANARTNKSTIAVNKTTTPTATGTFMNETPGAAAAVTGTGNSIIRTNFVETGETATGSNGFNGDDEMSEPGTNWTRGVSTPGTLP